MNRTGIEEDVSPRREPSLKDPIAEMSTWAGRHGGLREESSIAALGLSSRVTYALERGGIRTLADLADVTAADLMNLDGFDEDALVELEERLTELKLRIATPQEVPRFQLFPLVHEAEERENQRVEDQSAVRPPDYEPH